MCAEKKNETEIEITPEMIEACLVEYRAGDRRFESDEEIVARIYRAMAPLSRPDK